MNIDRYKGNIMPVVIESILFAFKEILAYKTIKLALLIGAGVTLLWSFIGYVIWDELISLSKYFIDLLPFSILRSNGAWILSSFLWFSLVLITFALIMMFFGTMILEKVSKEKYSSISLLVAFTTALFWVVVWFFYGDTLHEEFLRLLNWLPFETVEASIAYMLSLYFIYGAIIVTTLLVTSFYSEELLEDVRDRNFPYDKLLDEDEIKTSENRVRDIAIYTVVSTAAFPLLFIPIVNFIIQFGLWVWLIKDILVNDTAVLLIKEENREKLSEHSVGFYTISASAALFNFLPVFNIFGPFFGEIAMFYYMKELSKEL